MAAYLITYDLNKPGQNYPKLYDVIKELGSYWCHPLESVWLVKSNLTVDEISNKILSVIDKTNDYLFVVEVNNHKQGWLTEDVWNHLNTGIFN